MYYAKAILMPSARIMSNSSFTHAPDTEREFKINFTEITYVPEA